jgi:hypothetical protein
MLHSVQKKICSAVQQMDPKAVNNYKAQWHCMQNTGTSFWLQEQQKQKVQWKYTNSPQLKKFETQSHVQKIMITVFLGWYDP